MTRLGTLHILWANGPTHAQVPSYHVGFADYESGKMKLKMIVGSELLKSFLSLDIGLDSKSVEKTLNGLMTENSANIFDLALPEEKLSALGF